MEKIKGFRNICTQICSADFLQRYKTNRGRTAFSTNCTEATGHPKTEGKKKTKHNSLALASDLIQKLIQNK